MSCRGKAAATVERLDVVRALATLPPRQREAILLRYLADIDIDGVAEVMGCARGTAKSHVARGLSALRRSELSDDLRSLTSNNNLRDAP